MEDPAKLDAIAADIEACGSDHLKLSAFIKRLREEAADIRNPKADEKGDTSVDLTPQKRTTKKAAK